MAGELQTYQQVIRHLNKQKRSRHLLLGNGFSMAYDPEIFSYNALQQFVENIADPLLAKLFQIVRTKNFEVVMHQLSNFMELLEAFDGSEEILKQVDQAAKVLKSSLLKAIQQLHPEHVFHLEDDQVKACARFLAPILSSEGKVFSTNYDLLLYWVLMRGELDSGNDGFGYERLDDPDDYSTDEEWSELLWGPNRNDQSIHYLHGALPIFDTGTEIVKETYGRDNYLLQNIEERMQRNEYPVFVAAGDGEQKLRQIRHNPYLSQSYDTLCEIGGSLITFGFNFGDSDEHIIGAINKAASPPRDGELRDKLWSVYVGVFSDEDAAHIDSIRGKFHCKVNMFDSKSISIWS